MPGTTTDTVPTMLTPGEFVIKRESAKMLGKPFLEKLNAVSDNSAHSNIDALISQAALAQMQPMMGGGVVNEYMGGGDVSNYMGGGDVMNYRYGGGVKKKKKMAGYQDGGEVSPEMYISMVRKLIGKLGGEEPEGMYTPEGGLTREGYAKMLGADPESVSIDTLNFKNPANYKFKVSGKGALSGADVGGTTQSRGILPLEGNILDPLMREKMDDPFERMDMEMLLRKIKPQGYQEGGAVQEDAMMQDYLQSLQAQRANPFIPFDQRPPSSGEVMSSTPKGMEQGDYYMSLKNELEMENEELLRDKAQNTLDRIRLDSLLNQWKKGAERIERLPEDTSGFIPTVPMFKPEGMGI